MKNKNELLRIGKYMSLLLRHNPEKENLILDEYGYVSVKHLCNALKISKTELDFIVENNNKKRFAYKNKQKDFIRASQGHSINVKLDLIPIKPPPLLFHATTWKISEILFKEGLMKMSRHHVHLTDNLNTAIDVGLRYAKTKSNLLIIGVNSEKMWEDKYNFYKTENNVYLTDHVPSIYFKIDNYI